MMMYDTLILCLSDKSAPLSEACEILQSADYKIHCVTDATEAAVSLTQKEPQLFLLPYTAVTAKLMLAARSCGVPVVLLIDQDAPQETRDRVYALGAADYVTAPICRAALLARIRNQISVSQGKHVVDKANDDLYQFCLPVTHDLKNHFTSSAQLADYLLDDDALSAQARELVQYISLFCKDIKTHIEAIFNHAELESRHTGGYIRKCY